MADRHSEPEDVHIEPARYTELMRQVSEAVKTSDIDRLNALLQAAFPGNATGRIVTSASRDAIVAAQKLTRSRTDVVERIRQLRAEGMSHGQIAGKLNDEGFQKRTGTPWTDGNVSSYCHQHHIK